MRIALAGSGTLASSMFRPLLASHHEVVAIIQDGRRAKGFQRTIRPWSDALLITAGGLAFQAMRQGLPIVWIDKMDEEELAPLRALEPDIVLVGGFGIILREPLLSLPRLGCVNMHSSLLPKHRGPNPFCAVILAGETESGVTFHVMAEGIDTGDIIAQTAFTLSPEDTPHSVYAKSCELAGDCVVEVMDSIEQTGVHAKPQDHSLATYEKRPAESDAWIRWERPAVEIARQIRALNEIQTARFSCQHHTILVNKATADASPVNNRPGYVLQNRPHLAIATGEGVITILVAQAKGPLPLPWPLPWNRPAVGEQLSSDY